jgi:hypothetical protein
MFDNAYDLAMEVEASVGKRYLAKDLKVSHFIFNST